MEELPINQNTATGASNATLWGGIASAISNIYTTSVTTLNPKVRENQLAIAEANARAAEANAEAANAGRTNPNLIIGIVVVLIIVAVVLMATRNK